MQVELADFIKDTQTGNEIEGILRSCVHCGFCNATCPTYNLLGAELDGPRGRIYQIKNFVESGTVTDSVQSHLDRCLTCLSCTTTCPSGVKYNHLIDIARELVEQRIERSVVQQFIRGVLKTTLPFKQRFSFLMRLAWLLRLVLPKVLKNRIPAKQNQVDVKADTFNRKVLILEGCVQPTLTPLTNQALVTIFNRLGIEVVHANGADCCGAVSQHLMEPMTAIKFMQANIDAWWPHIEDGIEAVIVTASGCGVMVKDYGWYLRNDEQYRDKAEIISAMCKDPVEILESENTDGFTTHSDLRLVFQSPCSLQHGQKLQNRTEALLTRLGYTLLPVADAHLCCGSAGTYSILHSEISGQLKAKKINNLHNQNPDVILTANVGCQTHLQSSTNTPVIHWLELLAGFHM